MGAVRAHTKQKMGIKCPPDSLVLFRDRMVTNCLMKLRRLYNSFAEKSKEKAPSGEGAFSLFCQYQFFCHGEEGIRSLLCTAVQNVIAYPVLDPGQRMVVLLDHRIRTVGHIITGLFQHGFVFGGQFIIYWYKLIMIQPIVHLYLPDHLGQIRLAAAL